MCRRHGDSVRRPVRIFNSKKVGVCAGPFQKKLIIRKFIDQNPVGPYVAVASPDPISLEFVIAIFCGQRLPGHKLVDDSFYFFEVFAPLPHAFDILLELLGLGEIHSSHEA
jgi:hypothetical protein